MPRPRRGRGYISVMNERARVQEMVTHYLCCAFWAESANVVPDSDRSLENEGFALSDLHEGTRACAEADCLYFLRRANDEKFAIEDEELKQAGHDLWLTRNGHGSGFWDGDWPDEQGKILTAISKQMGQRDIYVGDDKKVYIMGCEDY